MRQRTLKSGSVFVLLVGFGLILQANAGTLGYWRFEKGASGNEILTAASEVDSPAMDGAQWVSNETNVLFSSDVAGTYIYDPVAEQYNSNTGSMLAPGTAGGDNSQILVNDMSVLDGTWTLEMFLKVENDGGPITWSAGAYNRIFNLDASSSCNGSVGATGGGTTLLKFMLGSTINDYSSNFEDGNWHHLAYVVDYDGTNTTTELFRDYTSVGSGLFTGQVLSDSNDDLRFGISSAANVANLDWFMDEVRLSGSALSTNQFLQVFNQVPTNDLKITGIQLSNVEALAGGVTHSGTVYRLQYTEQLTNATWTSLPLYLEGGNSNLFFVDPTGVHTQRFYRLVEE